VIGGRWCSVPTDSRAEAMLESAETPGAAKTDPILVVDGFRRSFGGVVSVDVPHLEVQKGIITSIIGPNGAGKTTLFNLLSGFDRPDHGHHFLEGQDITHWRPHKIARLGLVRTFQLTKALAKLRVIDNVKLAAGSQRGERIWLAPLPSSWRSQERRVDQRADALLERFGLAHMRDQYAGTLSGGQRKLLEFARALMSEPRVIMLDEPMAGVNPALSQTLMRHVESLVGDGLTVLFVEHDMDLVMGVSDWIICLAQGKVIAEGRPRTVAGDSKVIEAYLGTGYHREHDDASGAKRDTQPTKQVDQ
jgi:neutral amino acid transport system ATP-binding protein